MKIQIVGKGVPTKGTPGSAGNDLAACGSYTVPAGGMAIVDLGMAMAIPQGYAGMLVPRSSLAKNSLITLANSPGVIDSDYRGAVKALVFNNGKHPFKIEDGQRICQIIITPFVADIEWEQVPELDRTSRTGGFGSTGK